ncbi:hypothetical protein LTR78_002524 [Recurvomyces mirabilis]|uniref:Uncharacterized protein n=1 Tax=Recurvomyces mirabilis TaxID=574656 RepID=A0AAE0WTD5_9PEZI|nr:hypothetical protein LTR78_002524 [Recurvomyces mirabilis]KAK5157453.1 hypothetical protein LTS14_004218 [Recurvomyces mirabilis]
MHISSLLPLCAAGAAYAQATSKCTTTITRTTSVPTSTKGSAAGPPSTLLPSYAWIRAVETPNYHSYLQSNPPLATASAILGPNTSAGQFKLVAGQLEYAQDGSGSKVLYASVGTPASASATILPVSFSSQPGAHGTFAYSGDTLQWTTSEYKRPNPGAWLVCANHSLFINLGNYGYQTPTGCNDATIHSYGNSIADV